MPKLNLHRGEGAASTVEISEDQLAQLQSSFNVLIRLKDFSGLDDGGAVTEELFVYRDTDGDSYIDFELAEILELSA